MHKCGMFRARVSEWILSLVTTRERAAATVGDLVESSALGMISVLRIAASAILRQVSVSPGRVAVVALTAFVGQFVLYVPCALCLAWAVRIFSPWRFVSMFPLFAVPFFLTQIAVGKWMVRWSHGCEMAVCLALGVLNVIAGILHLNNISIDMSLWQIPILIGAIRERRLSLRRV